MWRILPLCGAYTGVCRCLSAPWDPSGKGSTVSKGKQSATGWPQRPSVCRKERKDRDSDTLPQSVPIRLGKVRMHLCRSLRMFSRHWGKEWSRWLQGWTVEECIAPRSKELWMTVWVCTELLKPPRWCRIVLRTVRRKRSLSFACRLRRQGFPHRLRWNWKVRWGGVPIRL